jgi:hypothetical protein
MMQDWRPFSESDCSAANIWAIFGDKKGKEAFGE